MAFTIGTHLDADLFSNANTLPNTLYILVAGGVFNVVLVPQMVRAMKRDPDGGEAYVNRVMTLGLLVLASATVVLMAAVPLLMHLVFDGLLFTARFDEQYASARFLMLLCMPQVFFYGTFVLLGQVLNSRGVFGPMMWAPIANNLVAIAMLGTYLAVFGSSDGRGGFTATQTALLGLGSTLGIAVQAALLVPYLRRAGFRFRPRFDFRRTGLGHTLRLGAWTLGFIVANQVAYIVVQRLGVGANLEGGRAAAAGSAVYEIGYLVSQMPHGIITVSLATALIPTLSALAADRSFDDFGEQLARVLRIVLAVIAPLAVAAAILGPSAIQAIAFGGIRANAHAIGWTVAAFAPAMVFFAVHYMMLRGFYAMENTRTPFLHPAGRRRDQHRCRARFHVLGRPAERVGRACPRLRRRVPRGCAALGDPAARASVFGAEMRLFLVRLAIACIGAALVMVAVLTALHASGVPADTPARALGLVALAGPAGAGTYLLLARVIGLTELASVVSALRRRP